MSLVHALPIAFLAWCALMTGAALFAGTVERAVDRLADLVERALR